MPKLGHKFNKSAKRLGSKIEKGGHNLGHKLNMALSKSDGTMRKIDNTMKDLNDSGAGELPIIGLGTKTAGFAAHVGHKATRNALERYNRRKATEDALSNSAGSSFV